MISEPTIGLRRRLKHAVAAGWGRAVRRSGMGRRFFASHIPIVFYHGIWPEGAPALAHLGGVDVRRLRLDLEKLAAHFDLVGLEKILECGSDDPDRGRPQLSVCFDDGCDMIRTGAIDILEALGVPATMFVVTDCIDNRHLMWMHKLQAITASRGADRLIRAYNDLMAKSNAGPEIGGPGELTAAAWCWPMDRKEEYTDALYRDCDMPPVDAYLEEHQPYMTSAEMRAWLERGHGVGLHTRTHPFCDRLASDDIDDEISAPATWLRAEFGIQRVPFAYPFGNRLSSEREADVSDTAGLACMLGVAGLSRRGTDPRRVERVCGEEGLDRSLFGKPVLQELIQSATRRGQPRPTLAVHHPWLSAGFADAPRMSLPSEKGQG